MRICRIKLPSSVCFVNSAPVLLKQRCPEEKQSQSATCRCLLTGKRCWMPVSPAHLPLSTEARLDSQPAERYRVYCTCISTPTLFKSVSGCHQELVNVLHWDFSNFSSNLNHRKFFQLSIFQSKELEDTERIYWTSNTVWLSCSYISPKESATGHWQTQMLYQLVHKSSLSIKGKLSCNNLSLVTALKKSHQN